MKVTKANAAETIVRLAPWIYNRNSFIFRKHPTYHPSTNVYLSYWEQQEKYSIEGFWGLDQECGRDSEGKLLPNTKGIYNPNKEGGWRWMTPQHYWYTQYCFIQHEVDDGVPETIQPDLRDIDWYWFYAYIVCTGFSGFALDDTFTCHALAKKYHLAKNSKDNSVLFTMSPKEKKLWNKLEPELVNAKGEVKEYVDPVEYLKRTFDKPMGKVLYGNTRKNLVDLESRGAGKSFRCMGVISQTYNFYGKRTWEQYVTTKKGPTICVGSALSSKSGELLSKFKFSQEQLVDNFGTWGEDDEFIPGWFHKEHAGTLNSSNEKNAYREQYKEYVNGVLKTMGTRTSIVHQSYETNPEAFVGQRAVLMVEDELGLNSKLLKSQQADETVMIMKNKIGSAIKTGTGGNIEKIQQAKVLYYDPVPYGYLGFKDHWENNPSPIGLFVPAYYVDSSFRDENGNQNVVGALEEQMHTRREKSKSDNTSSLDGWIIANPLVPSEMFLAPETNIFPVTKLREHRAILESKKAFEKITSIGYLEYTDKNESKVKWTNHKDKYRPAIKTFDTKQYQGYTKGTIVIYEHPVDNIPDPTMRQSLYKGAYDPVKDDGGGPSLSCIKIYKGYTMGNWNEGLQNTIVAEYYGRVDDVEEMHEMAFMLAIYYNCKILPETNIPDIIRYAKRKQKLRLLQAKPWDAISKHINNPSRKYDYGLEMVTKLKIQGEQLLNKWLTEKRGVDENGKEILTLHHIYSLRLLDELVNYDRKKNTDGVSTMFLIMFWVYQEELIPIAARTMEDERSKLMTYFEEQAKTSNFNELTDLYGF